MPQLTRQAIAEGLATFILVFIGAGSIIVGTSTGLTGIALAHGFAIFIGVAATAHISGGHINPAVTIGFLVTKRIDSLTALVYIIAQLTGALVAAGILYSVFPSNSGLGLPMLSGIGLTEGIIIESLLTLILVVVIFQTAGDEKGPSGLAPIAIGLAVAADILVGGPLTGAAMNPARWFGPALVSGVFDNALVYIIGPIFGGIIGAFLADKVLQRS